MVRSPEISVAEVNKDTIMKSGRIFLNGKFAVWIGEHHGFGARCEGEITIVAETKNDNNTFSVIGASCTNIEHPTYISQFNGTEITRGEIVKKIGDAESEERLSERLETRR